MKMEIWLILHLIMCLCIIYYLTKNRKKDTEAMSEYLKEREEFDFKYQQWKEHHEILESMQETSYNVKGYVFEILIQFNKTRCLYIYDTFIIYVSDGLLTKEEFENAVDWDNFEKIKNQRGAKLYIMGSECDAPNSRYIYLYPKSKL